ncbi:hypothetical protein SCUCBS95973_001829 [Sporothrix curviconia]|uniref:Zn(2)-C6 fungal-type domain-containing protein n=1 Tax=Sporothrix curviconia TaxID=1260050 RepID=A0ABP0B1X7_9PEZI
MEQIETQATDLRYLMQATAPPPAAATAAAPASHQYPHAHPQSSHSPSYPHALSQPHQHQPHPQQHPHAQQHPHPHPHPHPHQPHSHNLPHPSPYARLPSTDDQRHHAAISPRHLNRSSSTSSAAAVAAGNRPPPPVLHGLPMPPGDNSPGFGGATTPLHIPFSPDGPHNGYYADTANNGSINGGAGSSSMANNNNSGSGGGGINNASPGSLAGGNGGTPTSKRKQDDDESNAKQQRSKRNRYISIACNECKRRKIKCNGETPCQRCGNLNLACLYSPNCCSSSFKDSDEFKSMTDKIHSLEEQLESLAQNVNVLRQEQQRLAPLQDRILPIPSVTVSPSPSSSIPSLHKPELAPIRQPHAFRGPTSMAFTVDVAKNTLHNMGYSGDTQEDSVSGPALGETPRTSPVLPPATIHPMSNLSRSSSNHAPSDPLWEFDRDEMVRICRVHEDEVGIMYPVYDINDVIAHAQHMSTLMESSRKSGYMPADFDELMIDIRTLTLKIIMCCGLTVEEHGHSEKAIRIYDSIQPIVDKKLMSEPSDLANLPFLALVAGYRFLANDEILAWRVMGQVARHCLEQGLHRREGVDKITNEQQRRNAINTFWSAYVLDRRWSFGTGLPYVMHDDKIDPNLPLPIDYPYLEAMITYSRLGAKIWSLVDFFEPAIIRDLKREEFESLDREILQWYDTVPERIRISNLDRELPLPSTPSYNIERLQIWTRLRLNQIRIWLHTPVLHSASSINKNMEQAQKVVDLAKDTIRYLSRLNNSSNLYRRIQVFYHQFLTSAIAVLFLASTHQPVQFSADCREEFYMAMNLVKDMSAKSWVSQRLWRTIRSLKAYAPRLGLQAHEEEQHLVAATSMSSGLNNVGGGASGANTNNANASGSGPRRGGSIASTSSSSYHNNGSVTSSNNWPPQRPAHQTFGSSSNTASPITTPSGAGYAAPPSHSAPPSQQQQPAPPTPPAPPAQQQQQQQGQQPQTTASPEELANGVQIQTEMTRIFEGYMGMSGIPHPPAGTVHKNAGIFAGYSSGGGGGGGGSSSDTGTPTVMTTADPNGSSNDSNLPQGEMIYEHFKTMF